MAISTGHRFGGFVEGPTLADRIAEGPIPIAEALFAARQITDALEAAHEQEAVSARHGLPMAGKTITAGQPEQFFDWTCFDRAGSLHGRYDTPPDGQFLLVAREDQTAVEDSPFDIIVVQNWIEELQARVPTGR